ncbi:MAG: hypothetical protein HN764_14505 [Gammaproteobacteria bacterium]|nr:hypothetical protein [Gammaproteobacteria bacterium]
MTILVILAGVYARRGAGMTILVILAGVYARRGAGMTVWYKYLLKGK